MYYSHEQFHQYVIVDCEPGICPYADRRNGIKERRKHTFLGILRMALFSMRYQERRHWDERRTRDAWYTKTDKVTS